MSETLSSNHGKKDTDKTNGASTEVLAKITAISEQQKDPRTQALLAGFATNLQAAKPEAAEEIRKVSTMDPAHIFYLQPEFDSTSIAWDITGVIHNSQGSEPAVVMRSSSTEMDHLATIHELFGTLDTSGQLPVECPRERLVVDTPTLSGYTIREQYTPGEPGNLAMAVAMRHYFSSFAVALSLYGQDKPDALSVSLVIDK